MYNKSDDSNYNIDYYKIEYQEKLPPNSLAIEVDAPDFKKSLYNIPKYRGKISFIKNKILISFENSYDNLVAIFNQDLSSSFTTYLIGVAIGISDTNQKTPIAKKAILSKKILDNLSEAYFTINETEIINTNENLLYNSTYQKEIYYLSKYIKKLDKIESLFKSLSKNYYQSLYYQLFFNEFYELNKSFKLIENHATYTVKDRVRILKTLINSYSYKKFNKLNIVIPVLGKYYIFNHISEDAIKIKEALIELSKKVDIEIIFVVDNCSHKFTIEFSQFLNDIKDNIKIYFANKQTLEKDVNSLDFIYTDNRDFVIVKLIRATIQLFRFFSDELSIKEYEALFYKIKNRSIPYNDYFSDKKSILCKDSSSLMNRLSKKWHLYFYTTENIRKFELNIKLDLSVELIYQKSLHSIGNIINKEHQSVIILEGVDNKRVATIVFDNYLYNLREAFIVKIISKEYASNRDVMTIGICSSQEIELNELDNIFKKNDIYFNIDDIHQRLVKYLKKIR